MAKTVRDAKLGTRAARQKLKPSGKPYYRAIEKGLHLGYRKGLRGGKWVLRRYLDGGRYNVETIADADDAGDADGANVLTFDQAQERARARINGIAEAARIEALGPPLTVRTAVDDYVAERNAREFNGSSEDKGLKHDARSRLAKHVLSGPDLAGKALAALTDDDVTRWRKGLEKSLSSPQRVVNDFKAALNVAGRRWRAQLPPTFRDVVKDGLARAEASPAVAREAQVLPDADVRALIKAAGRVDAEGDWEGDLARMVIVLAATGARFSQVARLTVADVQFAQARLMVPTSRKGRGVKRKTHVAVPVGGDVLAALSKATNGRKGHEPLLLRPRWRQVGPAKWEKYERGPWHSAAEITRPWAAIAAMAGLAPGTIPYALRHSSIVRGLRAALPVRLVAALHDTSSAMIERHYGHFVEDALGELAARAIVPLTTAKVVPLPRAAG